MSKRLDEDFDDETNMGEREPVEKSEVSSSRFAPMNWSAHALMLGVGAVVVLMVVGISVQSAKTRLEAPVEKKKPPAVAAASDLGFCTEGFKTVLRRVLDSCGLLTANSRRGCTPGNLKQVAAISDKDFVSLFNPLADRAGILTFGQGKEELTDEALAMLEKKWMDTRGASVFLVVARASPEGGTEANQALSHKRANSVLFHLQKKFNDPELEQKVGLLWLGEEYAQLSDEYCKWEHAGSATACGQADINRSAFVSWVDCQL
jgi:outer membrane protein OmpA-like peptidoglycan-associated protein